MANVSFDAEFMKQWLPSLPISNAKAFQVVRDEQSRPIIFSIGTTDKLSALLPGGTNGQYVRLDLGDLFGLSTSDVVSSLFVLQDKELKIYLTFAVDGAKAGDPSTLYVVNPSMPRDWQAAITDPKKAPSLLKDTSSEQRLITQLHLAGAADTTTGYPLVVVVYSGSKIDATCLDINVSGGTWKYADTFELPETPDNVKDMCAGAVADGINGLFCLYDSQNKRYLSFASFKGASPYNTSYSTSLRPPPGAQRLATFINQDGFTDLLIGGEAVYHYTATDTAQSDPLNGPDRFVRVTSDSDPYFTQLRQITVAQDLSHDALCIYGRNGEGTVVYQRCNISATAALALDGPSIPLLTSAQGGGPFTVLLNKATDSQKLFIVGADNTLTCMEQSGGTRLWQRTVMLLPSAGENTEITTYTSHIHVADKDGAPLIHTKLLLCSSSAADLASNGVPISTTTDGVLVSTDQSGDITLIQNVTGLSSVVFTLKDDPHAAKPVLGKPHILNPAAKVQRILGTIKNADDARKAKLPNGNTVLDSGSAKSDDRDKAAEALPLLCQNLGKVPKDGSEHPDTVPVAEYYGSLETSLWDAWEWVHKELGKVEDFFVDTWQFVVTFAGKVYRFVLNSLPHILKALHWLLQDVLGIPIDTIIEWLGFLFNWGDIRETHNILAAMVNTGLEYAIRKTDDFKGIVDGWFDTMDKVLARSISEDVKSQPIGSNPNNTQSQTEDDKKSVTKTVGSNWSAYHVKHGGVGNSLRAQESGQPSETGNSLLEFLGRIEKALGDLVGTMEDAIKQIAKDFTSNFSIGQLLKHLGVDLLRDLLGVFHKIMVDAIGYIAEFATEAKKVINTSIDIPLLSALYHWISGNDLTMLDAIALLIAVPTTILCKAVAKKKPGDLPGVKEFLSTYNASTSRFMAPLAAGTAASPSSKASLMSTDGVLYASESFDDIFANFKSGASWVGSVVAPCGNAIMLLLAPLDWYNSGTGDGVDNHWGWFMALGAIMSAFSAPYGDIPGHPELYTLRWLSWGFSTSSVLATRAGVRVRGIISLATGSAQCIIEICSIYYAIKTAEDNQYGGNLDSKDVWLDICDRILSAIAKTVGGVCMVLDSKEPYMPLAIAAMSGGAIALELTKAVKFDSHAKTSMPQASLVGIT